MDTMTAFNIDNISFIEFDEQQKANLTLALRAAAAEKVQHDDTDQKKLLHVGEVVNLISDSEDEQVQENASGEDSFYESFGYVASPHCAEVVKEETELQTVNSTCLLLNEEVKPTLDLQSLQTTEAQPYVTYVKNIPIAAGDSDSVSSMSEIKAEDWDSISSMSEIRADDWDMASSMSEIQAEDCASVSSMSEIKAEDCASVSSMPKMPEESSNQSPADEIIELVDESDVEQMDEEICVQPKSGAKKKKPKTDYGGGRHSRFSNNNKDVDMLIHYICPQCNLSCGTYKKWRAHTSTEHNFNSVEELHMRRFIDRSGKIRYQCKDCQTKISKRVQFAVLLEHRITHLPYAAYLKCRLCDGRFKKRACLVVHLKKMHKKIYKDHVISRPTIMDYMDLFCPICEAAQTDRKQWAAHLNMEHNYSDIVAQRIAVVDSDSHTYACNECKRKCAYGKLLQHAVSHERYASIKCKYCPDYTSFSFQRCWGHIRRVHLGAPSRILHCSYCELVFTQDSKRNNHVRAVHLKHSLQCKICHQEYTTAARLLTHMNQTKHYGLK